MLIGVRFRIVATFELSTGAAHSTYVQYPAGSYAYNVDKNNLGPSIGMAWGPGGPPGRAK